MTVPAGPTVDAAVAAQYEDHPYPARDPAEEASRLIEGSPSHLDEVAHYVFAGALPAGRPLRILVAGGGTGDALVMLAQQVADRGLAAEITYLDPSAAARAIAEARLQARGLAGIRFVTGAIEALDRLAPGPYDYIDCCGVLHHLADPAAGLAALAQAVDPGGGLGLMVYAPYGREGVYALQSALRRLTPPGMALNRRIAAARRVLKGLPPTNGFRRNPFVGDHARDAAGLADLLLHARDRPYTVEALSALVAAAGLAVAAFVPPATYDPAHLLADADLRAEAAVLPATAQAALAEELAGNIKRHIVYAVPSARAGASIADPADETLCPVLRDRDGAALAAAVRPGRPLEAHLDGLAVRLPLPPLAAAMLRAIDGHTTVLGVKQAAAGTVRGIAPAALDRQFHQLFAALNGIGKLHLRRHA